MVTRVSVIPVTRETTAISKHNLQLKTQHCLLTKRPIVVVSIAATNNLFCHNKLLRFDSRVHVLSL